jgi:hypothetical protein
MKTRYLEIAAAGIFTTVTLTLGVFAHAQADTKDAAVTCNNPVRHQYHITSGTVHVSYETVICETSASEVHSEPQPLSVGDSAVPSVSLINLHQSMAE